MKSSQNITDYQDHKIKKDALEIVDHFLCPSNVTKNDLMKDIH